MFANSLRTIGAPGDRHRYESVLNILACIYVKSNGCVPF